MFDEFSASGSADMKFSAGMDKHEEIKQEDFHGWDTAAWIMNLSGICIAYSYFFYSHGIIVINKILTIFLCACFYSYTEDMAPIFDEIEVKDEPWIHSSEYGQVSYGVL